MHVCKSCLTHWTTLKKEFVTLGQSSHFLLSIGFIGPGTLREPAGDLLNMYWSSVTFFFYSTVLSSGITRSCRPELLTSSEADGETPKT